jgi:pimeloyl-ACP methyl ester carboxylesterase
MPTTRRSGVEIWYETEGAGPPVVLLHGMMGRSEAWRLEGYVDGLRDRHRLVLVDARGHGRSARPVDPAAYVLHHHVADVLAVLDELEIPAAALCGWSLGAGTALRAAATVPERVVAVAALGAPLEWIGFPDVPPPAEDEDDEDGWASRFEHEGMAWVVDDLWREGRAAWARLVGRADPLAMAACDRGWYRTEPAPRGLRELAKPLLVAWGDREVRPGDRSTVPAHARLVVVAGADHVGAFQRADILVPELRTFFAGVAWPAASAGRSPALAGG